MNGSFTNLVYTWDYRMRWAPVVRPVERGLGGRLYPYTAEVFLEDYTRAMTFLGKHGYSGVVIWGLLRDSHGGAQAARELCRRAGDLGMKVLAGVGINCYEGIYWEGANEFNLEAWVREHSDLAAVDEKGTRLIKEAAKGGRSMLCPSRPENLAWLKRGLEWLIGEVGVQGIWYEAGDYGMCRCESCRKRPGQIPPYSYADFADHIPALMRHAHALRGDLLQVAISYGTMPYYLSLNLGCIERCLPEFAWCAWMFEGGVGWQSGEQFAWRSVVREPSESVGRITGRDIGFLQYNCFGGYDDGLMAVERLRSAARLCRERGIRGLMTMGELPEPSNVVNYLAMDFFLKNPQAGVWDALGYALENRTR